MVPPLDKWWIIGRFRIPEGYVPIIVGVASGIFILVLTITAIVLWRCCGQSKHHRQKKYGTTHQVPPVGLQLNLNVL